MMTEEEKEKSEQIYSERLRAVKKHRSEPLIERIKNAFAGVVYPGNENIVSTSEHRAECEECQEIYDFFVSKTWEEILDEEESDNWLGYGQSFFEPLAWQYYLPAYLIKEINEDSFSSFYFAPNDDPELENFEENRLKLLTSRQCWVIVEFLEISRELSKGIYSWVEDDDLVALAYWTENYKNALVREQNLNR